MGNISRALMDCFYKNKLLVIEFRSLPSSSLLLQRPRQDPTEGRDVDSWVAAGPRKARKYKGENAVPVRAEAN